MLGPVIVLADSETAHVCVGTSLPPRDALYWGDCDDGVRELCEVLGWREELDQLVKQGHAQVGPSGRRRVGCSQSQLCMLATV